MAVARESHGGKPHGQPGDKRKVTRTIEVGMSDAMRFTPAELAVRRGELVWRLTKSGSFSFGCLVPGHFEAGMAGKITVAP